MASAATIARITRFTTSAVPATAGGCRRRRARRGGSTHRSHTRVRAPVRRYPPSLTDLVATPGNRMVRISWSASPDRFHRRDYRLKAGEYRWFVWPGFGSRAAQRYGRLLVHSSFVIRR
jgi:hypothetical protein